MKRFFLAVLAIALFSAQVMAQEPTDPAPDPDAGLSKIEAEAVDALRIQASKALEAMAGMQDFTAEFMAYGFNAECVDFSGTVLAAAGSNPITDEDLAGSEYSDMSASDIQAAFCEMLKQQAFVVSGDAPPVLYRVRR
jgi:hypothetical protein